jgi:hypothetical protein
VSPEKDAALCKDFPHLFGDRNAPMTQSAMCWGFECSEGWYDIIRSAAEKLEPIIVKMIDDAIKEKNFEALDYIPTTSQLKEKFGTLRWYLTSSTREMDEIVRKAEKESAKTCEQCGNKGKLRGTGWYFTMCAKCWKKHEAERGQ